MEGLAVNVCGQAPLHDENSWRAVGMCSLATKDRTCAQEDMVCERHNPGGQPLCEWQNSLRPGIAQHHGRFLPCSVLVRKMTEQ